MQMSAAVPPCAAIASLPYTDFDILSSCHDERVVPIFISRIVQPGHTGDKTYLTHG